MSMQEEWTNIVRDSEDAIYNYGVKDKDLVGDVKIPKGFEVWWRQILLLEICSQLRKQFINNSYSLRVVNGKPWALPTHPGGKIKWFHGGWLQESLVSNKFKTNFDVFVLSFWPIWTSQGLRRAIWDKLSKLLYQTGKLQRV